MNAILNILARFLVSLIFIMSGFGKITDFAGTSQFMEMKGFPMPDFFLIGAIFLEFVGGMLLLVGFRARIAATLLIVFLIPATLIFHVSGIPEQSQIVETLKNLAILGALVKFLADGAGAYSIDNRGSLEQAA